MTVEKPASEAALCARSSIELRAYDPSALPASSGCDQRVDSGTASQVEDASVFRNFRKDRYIGNSRESIRSISNQRRVNIQPALTRVPMSSCEDWIKNLRAERSFLTQVGDLNSFESERSMGSPSLFQASIPPRRTDTCSNPAFESILAALAERFSVRQIATTGLRLRSISSGIFPDSSVTGMLIAPAI